MSDLHDSPTAAFDDDRLLDYALGIEDDPELAAALSRSARLRERLADLKADLAAIETELRHAIPEPDGSYAEPSDARWPRLARAFGLSDGETAAAGRRPLHRRRLAVSLLAAAIVLALLIGVLSVLPRGGSGGSSSSASSGAGNRAAVQAPFEGAATPAPQSAGVQTPAATGDGAAGAAGTAGAARVGGAAGAAATSATVTAAQAPEFRIVAVVRAGALIGADQSFSVVRTLKGKPPASFSLTLRATAGAPASGALAIVYLRPLSTPPASASANPPDYSFNGQLALLATLPAGVAAAAVRLP